MGRAHGQSTRSNATRRLLRTTAAVNPSGPRYFGAQAPNRRVTMVNSTHWTSDAPIEPGWYWYRPRPHSEQILRIDDHGVVDSPREFDCIQATNLVGDWWTPQIQVPN